MNKCSVAALNTLSLAATKADSSVPLDDQVYILTSGQLERLLTQIKQQEARIAKLEENLSILFGLVSKNKSHGPTTIDRANKIKEIMSRRSTVSFAELRGMLKCNKNGLRMAVKLFLEANTSHGILEGSDRRSSLLVKIRH